MRYNHLLKSVVALSLAAAAVLSIAGCGAGSAAPAAGVAVSAGSQSPPNKEKIVMVWYPNESAEDYKPAREAFAKLITQATGREVEQRLTTDYAIAIEAIANGTASICFMGAQGYIEANYKSGNVQPLFVNSGVSGTLEDAIYYSFLNVNRGEESQYQASGQFSIGNIPGKRMSFVSNSSTSGFKVPTAGIISAFAADAKWNRLDTDALIEGGSDMFFSEVLFGGSHQGSAVNLLSGKADIAAFCDTEIAPYADCVEGTEARPGAVYKIKTDASAPFDAFVGKEFVVIKSTPVLNGPFAYNSDTLTTDEVKAIRELFTSDAVTNNPQIFVKKDSGLVGMFKKTDKEKMVLVEDAWYNPIRELGN